MAERRSIFANIAALATGQTIAMALGLITHAILARAVGPADYGILGFAIAVISYFGVIAQLGIDTWATREIAADTKRAGDVAGTAVTLRLCLSVASFVGVVVLVLLWDRGPLVSSIVLIQSASLFVAAFGLDFAFQGIERMEAVARRQVLSTVIALIGLVLALALGGGIVAATATLQGAAIAATIVMFWEFTRTVGFPKFDRRIFANWRGILRETAPLAVTGLLVTLYAYIDVIMLGFLRPNVEVGLYVASVRILVAGLVVATVLRTAFLPVLARLRNSPEERRLAGAHNARAVTAIGGLAATGGFVLAPEILTTIYGAEFHQATFALRLLMVNLLFTNVAEVYHAQLVAWRLQSQQMLIMIVGAVANAALNYIAIPRYGMEGAAFATIGSTLMVVAFSAWTLRRHHYETHGASIVGPLLLACSLGGLGWWIDIPIENGFARIVVVGAGLSAIYVAVGMACRIFDPMETLRYLKRS